MVDTNEEVLQAAGQQRYRLDLNGALRAATGLNLDANGIARYLFGTDLAQSEDALERVLDGGLLLDGSVNAYAETSDKAALDIIGDIDLRAEYVWLGPSFSTQILVAKWTPAANQSYRLAIVPALGFGQLINSSTGANSVVSQATIPFPRVAALRTTLDVDNGAAGKTARIYTAATLDGPWVEVAGSPVIAAGVTSIFASTAVLRIGATGAGAEGFFGIIRRAEVRNGIDGAVVANPDFRAVAPGTTSFADAAGNTWNLGSAARVT